MDTREAIITLRDRAGISRAEACHRMGTTPPTPESWLARRENGSTRIKIADLPRIARGLGVSVDQIRALAPDALPSNLAASPTKPPKQFSERRPDDIPVVNVSEDGSAWELSSVDLSNPSAVRGIPRGDIEDSRAIALIMPDDRLSPEIRSGDVITLVVANASERGINGHLYAYAAPAGHDLQGIAMGYFVPFVDSDSVLLTYSRGASEISDPDDCLVYRPVRVTREWSDTIAIDAR